MPEPRPFLLRRLLRPRMSLRVTMGVVLIVGIGLGWFITRARRQAETVEMVRLLGGKVQYDWESGVVPRDAGPKWLTDRVGPDYNHDVTMVDLYPIEKGISDSWAGRLAELHKLQSLRLGRSPFFTSKGLAKLSGLDQMVTLDISLAGIGSGDFASLKQMKRLRILFAIDIPAVDDDLANLSGLTELKGLGLQGDRLTDAGLAHLRRLTKMESFQLASNGPMQITSKGLAHLAGMVNLWQLVLIKSKVESLEPIRGMTSLTNLIIMGACLDDAGLAPLAGFTKLEGLNLSGKDQAFGDAGLAPLAGLKTLKDLFLSDTMVGDAGLAHLVGLSKLESLNLDGTQVTDAGLAQLARLPKLKSLSLGRTAITDAGLIHLARLKACREINLEGSNATPAGIASLRSKNPKLQVH
jgi:internalin A